LAIFENIASRNPGLGSRRGPLCRRLHKVIFGYYRERTTNVSIDRAERAVVPAYVCKLCIEVLLIQADIGASIDFVHADKPVRIRGRHPIIDRFSGVAGPILTAFLENITVGHLDWVISVVSGARSRRRCHSSVIGCFIAFSSGCFTTFGGAIFFFLAHERVCGAATV
jgi:hypothetical protein